MQTHEDVRARPVGDPDPHAQGEVAIVAAGEDDLDPRHGGEPARERAAEREGQPLLV